MVYSLSIRMLCQWKGKPVVFTAPGSSSLSFCLLRNFKVCLLSNQSRFCVYCDSLSYLICVCWPAHTHNLTQISSVDFVELELGLVSCIWSVLESFLFVTWSLTNLVRTSRVKGTARWVLSPEGWLAWPCPHIRASAVTVIMVYEMCHCTQAPSPFPPCISQNNRVSHLCGIPICLPLEAT